MNNVERVAEAEVILEWLKAEYDSPRLRQNFVGPKNDPKAIEIFDRVIKAGNRTDEQQLAFRKRTIQSHRQWGTGTGLFEGLVDDIKWSKATVSIDEIRDLNLINQGSWPALAPATRTAGEAANNVERIVTEDTDRIQSIVAAIQANTPQYMIITLRCPKAKKLIVLEGNSRAVALSLVGAKEHRIYIGQSTSASNWRYR